MTLFHQIALGLIVLWLAAAVVLRRSRLAAMAGLGVLGLYAVIALVTGMTAPAALGLAWPQHWLHTVMFAIFWAGVMFAFLPTVEWAAETLTRQETAQPDTLAAAAARQNLVPAIASAWLFGAVLEELVFRGVAMGALIPLAGPWIAAAAAAVAAGVVHIHKGPRAALMIAQFSFLFGVLYIANGYDLWSTILAHGLCDTIMLARYASGRAKLSRF